MKILLLGATGQIGNALRRTLLPLGSVTAPSRAQADLANLDGLRALLQAQAPDLLVNAAACTAVDQAENDPAPARRVNAEAVAVLAAHARQSGALLVHYSTDYVFDGQGTRPYLPDDATAPLGVYGRSKRDGEEAVRAAGGRHLIFRTAWVYAAHGHNFLRTMLRVGRERDELRVVADQIGTPTPAALIADATARALRHPGGLSGIWHLTASGQTSWHGFAEEIFRQALAAGMIERAPQVTPITTAEYPTPARRPAYSCLDTSSLEADFGIELPDWRDGVGKVLRELAQR